ncbi:DUF6624 domain-containing protein [Brevundimonas sp. A19_0]|uniref:DUF6624 domain-containing protein n=1 Tax=Brevundimonas sp. A19_0 TaxID=2821087 RepID=UPI001FD7776A|nr:DUF6624 domain-containing protein [Brevundimonas sp. A19_0]
MIALMLVGVLSVLGLTGGQDPVVLSPEARALIAPVSEAIKAEEARQAALPPPVDVSERLVRMGQLDQAARRVVVTIDLSGLPEEERQAAFDAMAAPIQALDDRLLAELLTLVPPEGWFTIDRYGERASGAAFLIIQHSDVEQWRRFVPILEPLALAGEIDGQDYGLMYDRLAVSEGRPQRYGTQVTCKGGRWVIDYENLEDPDRADERRASIGFVGTLAEYEGIFARYPPCEED